MQPNQLDPDAVNMAKAIRQTESGGNFNAEGKSGEYGAYQFTEPTWKQYASKHGVNVPLRQATPEQQNEVAYKQIKEWKDGGYNVGQVASMWNSGKPDSYLDPEYKGVNDKGAKFDVPAYAKSVATAYQSLKAGKEVGMDPNNPSSINAEPQTPEKKVGLFQGLVRTVASPFLRAGANIASLADVGNKKEFDKDMSQGVDYGDYLGKYRPIGSTKNSEGQDVSFGRRLADTVGSGVEAASTVVPVEGIAAKVLGEGGSFGTKAIEAAAKGKVLKAAGKGVVEGGIIGSGQGLGSGLQDENATTGSVIGNTILGGTAGSVLGGTTAGVGGLLGKSSKLNRSNSIVDKNYEGLEKLESSNSPLRKVIQKSKDKGIDVKDIVANTDLLHGAVDDTGTLRTTQEGGAVSQVRDFIEPQEKVISQNLEREGVSIPLKDVENHLISQIDSSGFKGGSKIRARNEVLQDIEGLKLDANPDGTIPLSVLHDAKIDKYANLNYLNPESNRSGKTIAKGFKQLVEKHTKSVDVKNLNKELSNHYAVLDFLEKLDGKKVEGGKLGKYFAQTVGSIVGSHFGPLGSLVGAEAGGRLKGALMKSKFSSSVGKDLQQSPTMKEAIARGQGLIRRLDVKSLPSDFTNELPTIPVGPKPRSKKSNLPTIKY